IGLLDLQYLEGMNRWYSKLITINISYGILFLPLITGVFASIICRYEHQDGGWKQLLAMPVTRGQVYLSKYLVLITIILIMQLLYLCSFYLMGLISGITEPFPISIVWAATLGGWLATFPLVALQLGLSIVFKSFAAPFVVNVIFTLPSIMVVNSIRIGPYYPWSQPFLMMNVGGNDNSMFLVSLEQLLTTVGGSFILFFLAGYFYFKNKVI